MVDSITEEILNASLAGVVKQMQEALFRTGFSTIIRESHDASCAVLTPDGRVASQHIVLPLHLGVFPVSVRAIIEAYGPTGIEPGDAFLINHPYIGGSPHAPDMCVIVPVFIDRNLSFFVASIAHKSDIGGPVPGSCSGKATDIYSEGMHFPAIRFVQNGVVSVEVESIIRTNSRTPDLVMGDIRGQLGCCHVGASRLQELSTKYGYRNLVDAIEQRIVAVKKIIHSEISSWPDHEAVGDRLMDDDGIIIGVPIKVAVVVKKQGSNLSFDFSETADQAKGPINIRPSLVRAACAYTVIASIGRSITVNQGILDAFDVITRPGSLLEPELPAPMNTYNPTVHAVINAGLDALGQIAPSSRRADGSDSRSLIFGFQRKKNAPGSAISYEIFAGGSGATAETPGLPGCHVNQTNGRITPIEILETEYPLRIRQFSVLKETGGKGSSQGGDAFRREYESLTNGTQFSIRSSRHQIAPRGVSGGEDGRPGQAILNPGSEQRELASREINIPLDAGDIVRLDTPSGGGCGQVFNMQQKTAEA